MKYMWLAYSMPAFLLLGHYLLQVTKFGLLSEGDLSNEKSWFAISNISETFQNMRAGAEEEDDAAARKRDAHDEEDSGTEVTFNSPSESEIRKSDNERGVSKYWTTDLGRWQAKFLANDKKLRLQYLPKSIARKRDFVDLYVKQ